jgi:hypothetical protein
VPRPERIDPLSKDLKRRDVVAYIDAMEDYADGLEADLEAREREDANRLKFARESETSRRAGLDNYPRADSQRDVILKAIGHAGEKGMTRAETADLLSKPINSVTARFTELLQGGFIREATTSGGTVMTRKTRNDSAAAVMVLTQKGKDGYRRRLEGLPGDPPKRADGSLARPPADLQVPRGLFDTTT